MIKWLSYSLSILTFTSLVADQIVYDEDFSPYAGGEDLITLNNAFLKLEDTLYPEPKNNGYSEKTNRLLNEFLITSPLNYLMTTVQHEVFGHGYRIRDIGKPKVRVNSYHIDAPIPYGTSGGSTNFSLNDKLTIRQMVAINIAGMEATSILANRVKMHWLKDKKIPSRQSTLYISSEQDIFSYVYGTDSEYYDIEHGNDVSAYIYWMNLYFPSSELTLGRIKKTAWLNLMDPMTFYSVYNQFYYIFTGQELKIPMIKIADVQFLPNLRYSFSPSGPELYLESFFLLKDEPLYTYIKWGNYTGTPSFGAGFEHPRLIPFWNENLGLRVNFFRELKAQNALSAIDFIQDPSKELALENFGGIETRYGYSFHLIYSPSIGKVFFKPHLELGYKSVGFVQGESLNAGLIIRGGFDVKY